MKRVELEPVNVMDDIMMIKEGLRQPKQVTRDLSLWTKTEKEKKLWKKYRRIPAPNSRWASPEKVNGLPGKLIVYVKGLEKSTYSHTCLTTDVHYLLSKYKTERSSIIKSSWNGTTFDSERLYLWRA